MIHAQLRGKPCHGRTKDTKVRSGPKTSSSIRGLFCYPDMIVICGEPEFHDEKQDVIINPTAIFEVLSESTERFDRGEKFKRYQAWNPTLRDYVLVSQTAPEIEHYHKQDDGSWLYRLHAGLEQTLVIPSINCTLALAEVYERVKFEE